MYVNLRFKAIWQFKEHPHYKVTRCKKVINTKTSKLLSYTSRGYFIGGEYVKKNRINNIIEKIPVKENLPF